MTFPSEDYGPLVHPKRVKDEERDDRREIRLNPLWTPLEDFAPELTREGGKEAVWLYSVTEDDRVVLGSEKVSGVLTADQLDDLADGVSSKNPGSTRESAKEDLLEQIDGLGHTGIAAQFDRHTGGTRVGRSRVAGEFRWSEEKQSWTVNDKSGRYMSRPVRPELTPQEAETWLENVARVFTEHLGVPVAADRIKTAGSGTKPTVSVAQSSVTQPSVAQSSVAQSSVTQPSVAQSSVARSAKLRSAEAPAHPSGTTSRPEAKRPLSPPAVATDRVKRRKLE